MKKEICLKQGGRLVLYDCQVQPKGTMIICPGGGYEWLSPREAEPVAEAFGKNGWLAAVLYYTVGEKLGTQPLLELAGAVSLMREKTPGLPVAVCGFSAGGHLTASLGVHWRDLNLARPDGLVLCYPVITAGEYAHRRSIRQLTDGKLDLYFSLEKQVSADMPPVFLWHTASDPEVPVQNSLLFAEAMAEKKVPFEMMIFPEGVHGLSLATKEVEEPEKDRMADPHVAGWFDRCLEWLNTIKRSDSNGILEK